MSLLPPGSGTAKWMLNLGGSTPSMPPLVVASNLTATSGGVVTLPASTPSTSGNECEASSSVQPKRKREDVVEFLKEEAEKEEKRHREDVERDEERERQRDTSPSLEN